MKKIKDIKNIVLNNYLSLFGLDDISDSKIKLGKVKSNVYKKIDLKNSKYNINDVVLILSKDDKDLNDYSVLDSRYSEGDLRIVLTKLKNNQLFLRTIEVFNGNKYIRIYNKENFYDFESNHNFESKGIKIKSGKENVFNIESKDLFNRITTLSNIYADTKKLQENFENIDFEINLKIKRRNMGIKTLIALGESAILLLLGIIIPTKIIKFSPIIASKLPNILTAFFAKISNIVTPIISSKVFPIIVNCVATIGVLYGSFSIFKSINRRIINKFNKNTSFPNLLFERGTKYIGANQKSSHIK